MTRVQRYIPHPPHRVWDAVLDPTSWWEAPERPIEVVVGARFDLETVPIVGTRFTGAFEVEILDALRGERLRTSLVALAQPGSPAEWERHTTFREHEGGTLLNVANVGVSMRDRDERLLLRAVKDIQEWELHGVAELLDRARP
ncbi:SRPBCC domain-containing protein [Mycobacteroides sp. LB1]|uniref:SRPBCC family protein n=1 Tax=Mycobacteroides sp. LB1 TaxID=2750814 RepID=UPI0015DD6F54|nr:SRPBCC domain-containing protein [Mycobacteroides sp. LB1]